MNTPIPNPTELQTKSKTGSNQSGRRLLLISDAPERMQTMESAFNLGEAEMTKATSAEDLTHFCNCDHELAIVDVEPHRLADILKTLRASDGHQRIPVLVERSRLTQDRSLACVLPAYRAMPCSFEEMMKLARRSLKPSPRAAEQRGRRQLL